MSIICSSVEDGSSKWQHLINNRWTSVSAFMDVNILVVDTNVSDSFIGKCCLSFCVSIFVVVNKLKSANVLSKCCYLSKLGWKKVRSNN